MKILVTGAQGFVGKNLVVMLKRRFDVDVVEYDVDSRESLLFDGLMAADVVFHLAGVNRTDEPKDFAAGNTGFTQIICDRLWSLGRKPMIIFSSSIQAALDNPYGISKRRAEETLLNFYEQTGAQVVIFRIKNVFGKWCRPNYNSVVATFCHNIARDLPISISNRANEVDLVYVDDVCEAMIEAAGLLSASPSHFASATDSAYAEIAPSFKITLGNLVDIIHSFKESRSSLQVPPFDDPFITRLYATYLSYLEGNDLIYDLDIKADSRGSLAEFLKSPSLGQIFISRTKPGITRGNHYHHTKTEKFFVVQGTALIRFRNILGNDIIEQAVSGSDFRVVDIPPGYAHSIENIGNEELVTIFWADEIYDPTRPDTFYEEVVKTTEEKS